MAIPKIKLYRLDQSYDPSNDTDIQSVNDDEIYPFVEKSLDLTKYEQLVGLTYRDLMVGKSITGFSVESSMLNIGTEEQPSLDQYKSEWINCDGWRLDNINVLLSTDGTNYSSAVPEKYYRLNFKTEPILEYDPLSDPSDQSRSPIGKRAANYVQVEFGKWIYSSSSEEINEFVPNPTQNPVVKVKLQYSLFTDDLSTVQASGNTLSLQRGHIYDGTTFGRRMVVENDVPVPIHDANGVPLKVEGNIGYKIKTYPCRQLVAYTGSDAVGSIPSGESFIKDVQIGADGKIIIDDCQSWILAQTDDRRPRLFQRIEVEGGGNSYVSYVELEQGTQYSSSLTTDLNGRFNLIFQLSSEYYNFSYGTYLYPKQLFIRFNEEDDALEDIFQPNYLDLSLDGNITSGTWSRSAGTDTADLTASQSYSSIGKRKFQIAVASGAGYTQGEDDLALSWSGNSFSISLPDGAYDASDTIRVWENGEIIYDRGTVKSEKYDSESVVLTSSTFGLSLSNSAIESSLTKPTNLLFSYVVYKSLSSQAVLTYHLTSDDMFQDGKQYFTKSGSSYEVAVVTPGASIASNTYYEQTNENPWAVGWRICAYEKTKIAKMFASSYRNWVSDHLNNSPDIFQGFTEYDGSSTNQIGIKYVSGGFSILHRNGTVLFADPVNQIDFYDAMNNYSGIVSINYQNVSYDELRIYTNLVYAKFAYYDGLQDVNNGLLRKISVGSNYFTYGMVDDPTYIEIADSRYDSSALQRTSLKNKRWIIRNDAKMPTIFYKDNNYLPSPEYVDEKEAKKWESDYVQEGKFLQINVSSYRSVFVMNGIEPPVLTGNEESGQRAVKIANISWSPAYSNDTELVDEPEANSVVFPVECIFSYNSSMRKWEIISTKIQIFKLSSDVSVVSEKEYFTYDSSTYLYQKVNAPINPLSNGYFEKTEINLSSRELTEQMSLMALSQIMKSKEQAIYLTDLQCPYDLIFLCCENGLIVSAMSK